MKKFKQIKYLLIAIAFVTASCETEFTNPNSVSEDLVYSSRAGIFAAAVGLQQIYSTTGMRWIIETPAVIAREVAITTTFQNMIELEDGGNQLPNTNSNVEGLWFTMARVMKSAQEIEANVADVQLDQGTISGLSAYAKVFRALAIGTLAQNYEQVILETARDGKATFVPRIEGFNRAIELLTEASAVLSAPVSAEFNTDISQGNYDLPNLVNALLARYNLFAGNYSAAIVAANAVDPNSKSEFAYDANATNPVWARANSGAPNYKPRPHFGLPSGLTLDEDDGRLDFYLTEKPAGILTTNQVFEVVGLTGFFETSSTKIPIYLPDEMHLIVAEASARSGDISTAIDALNQVLTDTDDIYGINAGLSEYSGSQAQGDVLNEIFKNRRAELYLTGLSLEDSRRFGRPEPSGNASVFTEERSRNFLPYPDSERKNNPNTPADPAK